MASVRSLVLKTAPSLSAKAAKRSSSSSSVAAALPPGSAFNHRGVVPEPIFKLTRPAGEPGDIEITAHAHPVEVGWIAEPLWLSRDGAVPLDGLLPHRGSAVFKTRSEAVEDALCRGLRQASSQAQRSLGSDAWSERIERLREWISDAMVQVRADDEALPLRGVTVADIFSGGSGGFGIALASLGASIDLACEIDAEARSVYQRNARPKRMHGNICSLEPKSVRVDILTMGLLCQAFSPAGDGLGFADPRRAAPYQAALRLLREAEAKVVVIECAKQLLTHKGGKDGDELISTLMAAGYRAQHRVLDAAGFGVPQRRERSVIVATRVGMDLDGLVGVLFPEERAATAKVADIMDAGVPATIAESEIEFRTGAPRGRASDLAQVGIIAGRNSQGYRVYDPTRGVGPTMTASGGGRARFSGAYRVEGGARALTPREACRMQGIPEWAEHHPTHKRAMQHAGNAVAVPVARELGRSIATAMRRKAPL